VGSAARGTSNSPGQAGPRAWVTGFGSAAGGDRQEDLSAVRQCHRLWKLRSALGRPARPVVGAHPAGPGLAPPPHHDPGPGHLPGGDAARAVVGVAAQLLLGWPWWLVAAGVVAAVWLFFASTALWGAGGSSQPLATDLLRVVRPHKAIERDHRQEVERFRAAPFPLYGLPPAWPGARHLGGWEGSWAKGQRPVTTALSLGHGDPLTEEGPQLRVEVRVEHEDTGQVTTMRLQSRRDLTEELWLRAAPPAHDLAEHVGQLAAARRRPDPAWSQVTIPVDGRPVAFEWLAEGRHWVARAELDDRTLTLHGRDLPVASVELAQVADLEPYIQGQRRLLEAWARHYDQEH
jgi:hypothetical protein